MKIQFLLLLSFLSSLSFSAGPEWKWTGFEILGNHTVSKDVLISEIPVKIGTPSVVDLELWMKWCAKIKEKHSFYFTDCNIVKNSDFTAYFTLDVVEKGEEYRAQFRPAPTKTIELANPEVLQVYKALQDRLWELFNNGTPSKEFVTKEYLDYEDPKMHELVLKLAKLAPLYQENILAVLELDSDGPKRMQASDLLNWVGNTKQTVMKVSLLLDDPHAGARNQMSRFMMHFSANVTSPVDQLKLVDRLLLQANRPSHGDRNKALYNLIELAQKHKPLRVYIKTGGEKLITYIAKTSVLSNVAGAAEELLKLINEKN